MDIGVNKTAIIDIKKKGIHHKNNEGRTSLHLACEKGDASLALFLVREGADINMRDNNGHTPLSIALQGNNYDLAISLINHGANISVYVDSTLLPAQLFKQCPELVKLLLPNGLEGTCTMSQDVPIFSSDTATLEALKSYVSSGGNVNVSNATGQSLLMLASNGNCSESVKYLIENGANVNAQDIKGDTALMYSAKNGNVDISETLLKNNADVNMKNMDEKTAIMFAVEEKHLDLTKKLVEYNADISLKDINGENVLIKAVKTGSIETIKFFVEECCENETETEKTVAEQVKKTIEKDVKPIEKEEEQKNTNIELVYSTNKNQEIKESENIIKSIKPAPKKIKLSSFIDAQDNNGSTPLMHAYEKGEIEIFKYLLEQEADPLIKDNQGKSVVEKILYEKNNEFTKILNNNCHSSTLASVRLQNLKNRTQIKETLNSMVIDSQKSSMNNTKYISR